MTAFPNSPRLLKGAIVSLDPANPVAGTIVFQYNPETVTRRLTPLSAGAGSSGGGTSTPGEPMRLVGPPEETLNFDIILDATDELERGDPTAAASGVLPRLSQLEMLIYPKSALVAANEVLLRTGVVEVIAPEAPLTVLILGPSRILPVRITECSISEELFDPAMNPIHAKVTLGLRVLTYRDLGLASPGGALFFAHQVGKEVLATIGGVSAAAAAPTAIRP